jgi:putative hydrolase of the HAD superfamily
MTQLRIQYALFDLDDTIYPRSAGVMGVVSQRIDGFMASRLGMDETLIRQLRPRYWQQYGTTMRGLLQEYQIDAEDYLSYVHDFTVDELLARNERLDDVLAELSWHKVIFTNAPVQHARQVLDALGVAHHFERIFDVRDTGYVGKPDPGAFRHVLAALGVEGDACIALDDSIPNLKTAKSLSMVAVLVGSAQRMNDVDFAIGNIEEVAEVARDLATG